MTNSKFATGAFVFARARGIDPRLPADLPPLADRHGVDQQFLPSYAGDRVAVGRAITQATSGLAKNGILLRPIKRTASHIVYGVVREAKDEAGERLDHEHEATVSWSAEPDPDVIHGDHPVAIKVADAYRDLRGKIVGDDWSAATTSFLLAHDAARIRSGVFWVPPQQLSDVQCFVSLLGEVGVDLVLCEIEAESRQVVEAVAHQTLEEQIEQLRLEAAQFDGTQKPTTYSRRLEHYQRLRSRAVLYREALGVGIDAAESVLSELEHKVTTMLDVRKMTVMSRRPEPTPVQPHASQQPALRFAAATFRLIEVESDALTFASGERAALASVHTLESIGLANRWQPAGNLLVNIRNSGPIGSDVSITVKPARRETLGTCAGSLRLLGIELIP